MAFSHVEILHEHFVLDLIGKHPVAFFLRNSWFLLIYNGKKLSYDVYLFSYSGKYVLSERLPWWGDPPSLTIFEYLQLEHFTRATEGAKLIGCLLFFPLFFFIISHPLPLRTGHPCGASSLSKLLQ